MNSIQNLSSICALALATFSAAAQAAPNATPSNVTCAAALSIAPTNKETSPDFEQMRQYFHSLATTTSSAAAVSKAIAAEVPVISRKTLEERVSLSRSCGMRYIEANPGIFSGLNKTI